MNKFSRKREKKIKIVFTGGGSGGHIFPVLAIIRQIKKNYSKNNIKFYYIGPDDKYGLELLSQEGVKIKKILAGKLRRYFSLKTFLDILKFPISFIQAFFWLFIIAPDLVFSKGGHGSFPASLMAYFLSIPVFVHESDIVPGLASRIESKWAKEIFVSFPKTLIFPKDKRIVVGNPVREELLKGSKEKAKEIFKLQGDKPLILILGGSQGAKIINETILMILPNILKDFEIIHQIGERNFEQVKKETDAILFDEVLKKSYHPFSFLKENFYINAFCAADLIISRAGGGSIFEISAVGKPAILIPITYSAQNHQIKNAHSFIDQGGGDVIEERNLRPHFFWARLKHLFSRQDILEKMAQNSKEFSRPKAAKIIASYLMEYLNVVDLSDIKQ